jgi:hypothetical protein
MGGWTARNKRVVVLQLQLIHNVKRRWDSVYFMTQRLSTLRPVSSFYLCMSINLLIYSCDRLLIISLTHSKIWNSMTSGSQNRNKINWNVVKACLRYVGYTSSL